MLSIKEVVHLEASFICSGRLVLSRLGQANVRRLYRHGKGRRSSMNIMFPIVWDIHDCLR